jgi:hypothetical protein
MEREQWFEIRNGAAGTPRLDIPLEVQEATQATGAWLYSRSSVLARVLALAGEICPEASMAEGGLALFSRRYMTLDVPDGMKSLSGGIVEGVWNSPADATFGAGA